jgi:hypothetical protein
LTLMGIKNLLTLVPTIREEGSKWIDWGKIDHITENLVHKTKVSYQGHVFST